MEKPKVWLLLREAQEENYNEKKRSLLELLESRIPSFLTTQGSKESFDKRGFFYFPQDLVSLVEDIITSTISDDCFAFENKLKNNKLTKII